MDRIDLGRRLRHDAVKRNAGRRLLVVVEDDLRGVGRALAELFLHARDDITGCRRIDHERRDPFLAGRLVGDGEHDRDVRVLSGRDELLDSVQHIGVAALFRSGRDRGGVGPIEL